MGTMKTLRKVQEAYVWLGMKSNIQQIISKCPTCIVHSKKKIHVPMGEMPLVTAPGQIVSTDLIGLFVASPSGNVYILVVLDHATGHADSYGIPRKTNKAVWKILRQQYFPKYGDPQVIITDQGLEFNAQEVREFLKGVGIKHHRTTPYNPAGNGRTERFNLTLKTMISKLANNKRDEWEDQLGTALSAYNNSTSTVTGHTPFFLMFGRRARLPNEPLTITSSWDPHWTVTQVRGKVVYVRHEPSGKTKVLNRDKVQIVDPDVNWDGVNPRPVRQSNKSTRLTGVRAQTAHPQATANNIIQEGYIPDPPPQSKAIKRKATEPLSSRDILPAHSRTYLHRAAKPPPLCLPSVQEQKRARLELIECVSVFLTQ